jgi:hypothetical protein
VGYVKEPKVFRLVWDTTTDHPGLQVTARSVSLGRFLRMSQLASQVEGDEGNTAAVVELFQMFSEALTAWNLEHPETRQPIPPTLDGLYDQDLDFVLEIILKWLGAMTGVSADLGKGSASGARYPEGSLPMAPLSQNHLNSNTLP